MKMYYCCIEDIFEGIYDSKERCIEAIKERFNAVDWMREKPILKSINENPFKYDGIEAPIVDYITVQWNDFCTEYSITEYEVNITYSC